MHLTYVVQQFPPEVGAGPARVAEFAQRWRGFGVRVTVITAMPSRMVPGQRAGASPPEYRRKIFLREQWEQLDVLRSWCYSSPGGGMVRTVANNTSFMLTALVHATLRMPRTDVLIASSPPFFPHITGRLLAAFRRTPLVLEVRDLWPDYLVGLGILRRGSFAARRLFQLERSLLQAAAAIVVVTEAFREKVIEKGIAPDRVLVVPNGVDLERYRGALPAADRMAGDAFTLGYLGNFGAGQDLTIAVRAAALLQQDRVRIVLVGDGPDRARVEAHARAAGLNNLTIRDSIPKEQTEACYHSFDVCFTPLAPIPELQDTIPSKIFEIMACERPVLASAGGETRRLVERSGCGIAVAPGDAAAVAAAVRTFRSMSPGQRAAFGTRGREYVRQYYSRDLLARRYYELLLGVVNGRRARDVPRAMAGESAGS